MTTTLIDGIKAVSLQTALCASTASKAGRTTRNDLLVHSWSRPIAQARSLGR